VRGLWATSQLRGTAASRRRGHSLVTGDSVRTAEGPLIDWDRRRCGDPEVTLADTGAALRHAQRPERHSWGFFEVVGRRSRKHADWATCLVDIAKDPGEENTRRPSRPSFLISFAIAAPTASSTR